MLQSRETCLGNVLFHCPNYLIAGVDVVLEEEEDRASNFPIADALRAPEVAQGIHRLQIPNSRIFRLKILVAFHYCEPDANSLGVAVVHLR